MSRADQRSILVVEDEETLAEAIEYQLTREGFVVQTVEVGSDALASARISHPDLVVLDLMLPGLGGLDVLRQIRGESDVPVIILTAKDSEADRVAGLELGADDYVTKPFSMRELLARVRANLRRSAGWLGTHQSDSVLRSDRVQLDPDRHEVRVDGEIVPMRPKEFELLEHLLMRQGRLVTREQLLDEVWGAPFYGDSKTLDVHVRRIREKIEVDPSAPELIVTVRGLGYKFRDDA